MVDKKKKNDNLDEFLKKKKKTAEFRLENSEREREKIEERSKNPKDQLIKKPNDSYHPWSHPINR